MKTLKKLSCLFLALTLVLALPVQALAEEYDLEKGSIVVDTNEEGQYVTQSENNITQEKQTTPTVIYQGTQGETPASSTDNTVTIRGTGEANVTLENVNIDPDHGPAVTVEANTTANVTLNDVTLSNSTSPVEIRNGATVNVTLEGTNTVTSDRAAIEVSKTATLTITEESTGSLKAIGGSSSAGIGSGSNSNGSSVGTINIHGGTVNAQGGSGAAGIGSAGTVGNTAGTVNITGGTVNAIGGDGAAGIGGGSSNDGGTVNISGGTVNATGGAFAAGIGGGTGGKGGTVNITGGTVNATGGVNGGAGIGGGLNAGGGTTAISGGTVTATGGLVTITGNEPPVDGVKLLSRSSGAGIGGGGVIEGRDGTDGGTTTITGGTVKAAAGKNHGETYTGTASPDIGGSGGKTAGESTVTITGGNVNGLSYPLSPAPAAASGEEEQKKVHTVGSVWDQTHWELSKAAAGSTFVIDAGDRTWIPRTIIETAQDMGITLIIQWDGGEDITIEPTDEIDLTNWSIQLKDLA